MRSLQKAVLIAALAAGAATITVPAAQALPLGPVANGVALSAQISESSPVIQVRRRGGAIAAGIIGGAILGGLIASQAYPYPYGYYAPPPYPVYAPPPYAGPGVAYCMRRFRSYDPYSMTYLGYDGFRHPCP